MCDPRPQREQKRPQTVPVKTQPGLGRPQSLEKRQWASGSSFPTSRLCCGPEPQAAIPPCSVCSFRPHSRGGGRGTRGGRGTQRGGRRRHGNSQPKRENRTMWPRTSRGARSVSAASYSPCGSRDQRKRPYRSPASRDTSRPCHASLPVQVKREQDAFRLGDGAPARPPTSSPSRTRAGWPNPAAWSGVIAEKKRTPKP